MCDAIYRRAMSELFPRTYGGLPDRDRMKVVQLLDRLIARGLHIHVDDLRRMCREVGYAEYAADDIGRIYDDLILIREELENPQTLDYWPPERIERIIDGVGNEDIRTAGGTG
jgi:hypothetical protein